MALYFCIVCGLDVSSLHAESSGEVLIDLKARIENLKTELSKDRREQKKQQEKLERIEKQVTVAWGQLRQSKAKLNQSESSLHELKIRRATQIDAVKLVQSRIEEYLVAAYQAQMPSPWQLMIGESDPSVASRFAAYYGYFHSQELENIDKLQQGLKQIDATEVEILAAIKELNQLKDRHQRQLDRWQAQRTERSALLINIKSTLASKDEQLKHWQAEKKRLLEQVAKSPSMLADGVPLASLQGRLRWPVKGQLVQKFGTQRIGGTELWQGVLIRAPEGSEVRAIHAGKVVYADWLRGLGLLLIVDHGENYLSLYGHNAGLYKAEGDWVVEGELLANVGDTGGIEAPALYFEIRQGAKPLNPQHWCKANL
jgi:murein hydrolase activator